MKPAINLGRMGAAFGLKSVGLKGRSQLNAQRLLGKRKRAYGADHRSGELLPHKLDGSPVSEVIRLAQEGDAGAFEVIYQQHSGRV
jgi:hypothetical protein